MPKKSAGLLVFRKTSGSVEVLLVHPGGPFWANKENGAWSIPKGEFDDDEDAMSAAKREFAEETGVTPTGHFIALKPLRQPSGKLVYGWALESDLDPSTFRSNTFRLEWPPRSGQQREFPEIDRAAWFTIDVAAEKILKGQANFLAQLLDRLTVSARDPR